MYVILLHPLPSRLHPSLSQDEYTQHSFSYVAYYDPNENGGSGLIVSSADIESAKRYPTLQAAVEHYQSVSTTMPIRADGKPNRPLTMYSAEVLRYDVAKQISKGGAGSYGRQQNKGSNNIQR